MQMNISNSSSRPGIQYLQDYLKRMQAENPSFFYATEDDNEHSGNVFWADLSSQVNYNCFGDTVRIDTSYRATLSTMPFITFTGINHHAQPILFGCALVLKESDNTFIWLLESFLQAMSGRIPLSVTCDPDRLIQMAVNRVLPDTRYRFCRWSIFRQTQEKMSSVFQTNPAFDFEFKKCVNEADTMEDFESSWATLLSRYFLVDNEWLRSLHSIRDQWVPVYLRDIFFGELSVLECNATLGSFFDGLLYTSANIQMLVEQYEKAVTSWHENELKDDFDTSNTMPVLKTPSPMEKQAADLYTRKIFLKFQCELVETLANPATVVDDSGAVTTYRVAKFGEEHKAHIVKFSAFEMRATCSCRMFNSMGIICRHVLSVFRAKNVLMLPSEYVLRRWTRNAKTSDGGSVPESAVGSPSSYVESRVVRQNNLRQEAMKYVEEGSKSIHSYNVAMNALQEAHKRVAALRSKKSALSKDTIDPNGENLKTLAIRDQSSFLSREEKEKKICELSGDLERTNQKCKVYRTILQALFRDIEDQKLKLSVKVQNARLSLKE